MIPSGEGESTRGRGRLDAESRGEPAGHWESLVGRSLGRYRILEKVGEGGMAVVFRAVDSHLGRTVALKIPKLSAGDNDGKLRFLREARAAAALHHSGICPIHDVGEIDGIDYLTMAFVEGNPLNRLISPQHPFAPHDALFLVRKLALALAEAHELGIVHRDLKPSNVMINRHGDPIVMDFGLARRWDGADTPLTLSGSIVGTPAYMSPEQVEGSSDGVGPATDIYSLGVVLFELLTGRKPFEGSTAAMLGMIAIHPTPAPSSFRPDLAPALDSLCLQALAKKPADRFPTMRAFAAALEEFAGDLRTATIPPAAVVRGGSGIDTTSPTPLAGSSTAVAAAEVTVISAPSGQTGRPVESPRSSTRVWIGTAALALAAAVVTAVVLTRPPVERTAKPEPPTPGVAGLIDPGTPQKKATPALNISLPEVTNWRAHLAETAQAKPAVSQAPVEINPLARDVKALFVSKCAKCHSSEKRNGGLTILVYESLFAETDKDGKPIKPFLKSKEPDHSRIWEVVDSDLMPEDAPLDDQEKARLRQWIEAGAPRWADALHTRPFVNDMAVLTTVRNDLSSAAAQDRPFLRYFSLAALSNGRNVSDDSLRLTQAALSKACNSLSREHAIAVPRVVDQNGAVLAIDLRDFGWDRQNHWEQLQRRYPYAISYERDRDPEIRSLAGSVSELSGTAIPVLRVDWFVATATRPPLYVEILELPDELSELEKWLRVDVVADFQRDRLVRGGVLQSGISQNSVVVDRHSSSFGGYWRSFDFAMSTETADILQRPLGPSFPGNDFEEYAFKQDLIKAIYRLPNGLQGYYLADARGRRIDEGGVNVIRDPGEASGTPTVVTGLSCMSCHHRGTISFDDAVGGALAVEGAAEQKARRLFGDGTRIQQYLDADEKQFLAASRQAMGPFLRGADGQEADLLRLAEPVSAVSRAYSRDVSLEDAAFELGLNDPAVLKKQIEEDAALRKLGLRPLADGGRIKRSIWATPTDGLTLFQKAALQLGIAIPRTAP